MNAIISLRNKTMSIWNHAGFQRYGRNTLWMLFGKGFNMAISFLVVIFIVRYLGPEKYGVLTYALGFTTLFSVIARMGVDGSVYRDLISNPEDKDVLLGSSIFIKFWASLFSIIIGTLIAILIDGFSEVSLFIFILFLSFLFKPAEIFRNYFQAEVNGRIITVTEVVSKILKFSLIILGIYFQVPLVYFIIIYSLDLIFPVLLLIYQYSKNNNLRKLSYNKIAVIKIIRDSLPLLLNGILATILAKTDIIMVKHFLGETKTGIYGATVNLSEFWYVIPAVIITSFFPAIVRSYKRSSTEYRRRANYLTAFLILISFFISIIFTFGGNLIVRLVFGSEFISAGSVLAIYIWSSIGMSVTLILKRDLLISNNTNLIFLFSLSAVLINLILNLILIPNFGVIGAASATVISSFIFGFLYMIRKFNYYLNN